LRRARGDWIDLLCHVVCAVQVSVEELGAAGPCGARRYLEVVLHVGVGRARAVRGGQKATSASGIPVPSPILLVPRCNCNLQAY
jgi:hypothetical protein